MIKYAIVERPNDKTSTVCINLLNTLSQSEISQEIFLRVMEYMNIHHPGEKWNIDMVLEEFDYE